MNWITLVEFSNKYAVSISTLRRRIKNNSIQFKVEAGKYYVLDDSSSIVLGTKVPEELVASEEFSFVKPFELNSLSPVKKQMDVKESLEVLNSQNSISLNTQNNNSNQSIANHSKEFILKKNPLNFQNTKNENLKVGGEIFSPNRFDIENFLENDERLVDNQSALAQIDIVNAGKSSFGVRSLTDTKNQLVEELKKAFTQVLHEKEEQIFQLKEEIADLKTLVKVLESELERLSPIKFTTNLYSTEENSPDL